MSKAKLSCTLAFFAALGGCSSPLVHYVPINGADDEGLTKFQLAESIITFDHGKTAAGIPNDSIVIASVPVPYSDKKYGIDGTGIWENWGVVTVANPTFRGDTTLIQQLAVTETDERVVAINALGGIASNLGGLLSNTSISGTTAVLPKGISVTNFVASPPKGCSPVKDHEQTGAISCKNLSLEGTSDFTADITLSAVPIDALAATKLDTEFYSTNFYYSACRQMTIVLKPVNGDAGPVSVTMAVADPHFLESLKLPAKGTITVAPSCGANAAAQDANLPTAIDYLNAISAQAKAIKQSLKGSGAGGK